MIKNRNTTVLASKYQSTEELKKFVKHCTGAKMFPVQGKSDAFWLSGDKRGDFHEHKKYKIVFGPVTQVSYSHDNKYGQPAKQERPGYGFDIQTSGDYNGWSLMGEYRKMIEEAMKDYKAKKETAKL
jgi:hypothetical protein